jgi:phosphate transport system substrate-binding protein
MKINIIFFLILFIAITACSDNDKVQTEKPSLPTSGNLTIGIDESLRPVTDAEIKMFSVYYPNAHITPLYLPEKQVVEKLLSNEIQTGIICRNLYEDESASIKARYQHSPETFRLAEDAIVPVVNNTNPLNDISYDQLKKILTGQITTWEQIDPVSRDKSHIVVVMTAASSINRYFSTISGSSSTVKSYALDSTTDVINYIKANNNTMGILGGSWFYQKGNKYPEVKVLGFSNIDSAGDNSKEDLYREVFAITHEPFKGLGTGLISFLASQKGQLILEKAGMTPYKPISREIEISHSFKK